MAAVAEVYTSVSSLGAGAATFGLQALAKQHVAQGLEDHLEGRELRDPEEARRLLDALDLASGAYRANERALAAFTTIKMYGIRRWQPACSRLQPGYYIAVDHSRKEIVWGVRGTKALNDLVTDLAAACHPLAHGHSHWGMTHAAHWLLDREMGLVAGMLRHLRGYRLHLLGHSMGGGVAALMAHIIHHDEVVGRLLPPERVICTTFGTPCVMSQPLAMACRSYITTVVLGQDIVSRLNTPTIDSLKAELAGVDWYSELQTSIMDHQYIKVSRALVGSTALASALHKLEEWRQTQAAPAASKSLEAAQAQAQALQAWLQDLVRQVPGRPAASAEEVKQAAEAALTRLTAALSATLPAGTLESALSTAQNRLPSLPALLKQLPGVEAVLAAARQHLPSLSHIPALLGAASDSDSKQQVERRAAGSGEEEDGEAVVEAVAGSTARVEEAGLQPAPVLLLPGRILYIRRHHAAQLARGDAEEQPAAAEGLAVAQGQAVAEGRGGSSSKSSYSMVAAEPGSHFKRLVLGPTCLSDHRCRAYRTALLQLMQSP